MKLDQQTIQLAAITLLNENGLEALSMRSLAKALDVKAASLYFHFKNRNALMEGIAELISGRICQRLVKVKDCDFYQLAHILREELKRVNDSPKIFESTYPFTPNRTKLIMLGMKLMQDLGVDKQHLTVAGNMGNNFVLSYVADEQYFARDTERQMPSEFAAQFTSPIDLANPDEAFDYGLNVFIHGLQATAK
ncbi:TetR family transcriptional regulator [Companilactobacillus huachuanensis]|uniref:TetR family transcriptional regulator n=1 Tax=Companilactobacillus huachuanensis TaxID=2559914 RepID=A0ABW1RNL5_9LACO|nr:TetR family transcriptional regulator [Companilactobacillus huachuanensis]